MTHPANTTQAAKPPSWSIVGVTLAGLGYIAALRPSLLPRPLITEVEVCALVAMTMYAIGAISEGAVRWVLKRPGPLADAGRRGERVLLGVTIGVIVVAAAFTWQGVNWQAEQFEATGVPGSAPNPILVIILTLFVSIGLLFMARAVRALGRVFAQLLARWTRWSCTVRALLGGFAVFACFVLLSNAVLTACNVFFTNVNNSTAGQSPPTSSLRSGGPGSLIPWSTLGNEGRDFVGQGPSAAQIQSVTGEAAMSPIRTYAGLESADSVQSRAQLAIADLVRAGGLDRAAVIVYTTSTNGLVDPTSSSAAEYVSNGNVASASMQYTVLPSFISFALARSTSLDAGKAIYDAARAAIDEMPTGSPRPKLYVYGESLGAFGSQSPFTGKGVNGVPELVDGAIWAGPPGSSDYWTELNALADGGTGWQPIVQNGTVTRFAANANGLAEPASRWGPKRGVYLQNSTDPVVWFGPGLVSARPDWLDEPRGPGVPAEMTWLPLITFEQVLCDLPAAGAMPPGVGHNYQPSIGPAWVAVLQPSNWTADDQTRLQNALTTLPPDPAPSS